MPTELVEKTNSVDDLGAASAAFEMEGAAVESAGVALAGACHSPMKRQCFIGGMGSTELAVAKYSYSSWGTPGADWVEGLEYAWSTIARRGSH